MDRVTEIECQLNARTIRYKNLVEATERRVANKCKNKNVTISWSTGKDSTVMMIMLLQLWIEYTAVTIDWGKHRPDSHQLVSLYREKYKIKHEYLYPEYSMERMKQYEWVLNNTSDQWFINKNWFMTNYIREPIKKFVKKNKVDIQIVGLRNQESKWRAIRWRHYWDLIDHKKTGVLTFRPLNEWRDLDVWTYITMSWMEYNTIYDKMQETFWWRIYEHRCAEYFANATLRSKWPTLLKKYYPELYEQEKALFPFLW